MRKKFQFGARKPGTLRRETRGAVGKRSQTHRDERSRDISPSDAVVCHVSRGTTGKGESSTCTITELLRLRTDLAEGKSASVCEHNRPQRFNSPLSAGGWGKHKPRVPWVSERCTWRARGYASSAKTPEEVVVSAVGLFVWGCVGGQNTNKRS